MTCFIFHKWGFWESGERQMQSVNYRGSAEIGRSNFVETYQRRECKKCKIKQEKIVHTLRSI